MPAAARATDLRHHAVAGKNPEITRHGSAGAQSFLVRNALGKLELNRDLVVDRHGLAIQ
jgi:hypothetical protein